jgi:flagellar basal body-associated protein FliL
MVVVMMMMLMMLMMMLLLLLLLMMMLMMMMMQIFEQESASGKADMIEDFDPDDLQITSLTQRITRLSIRT